MGAQIAKAPAETAAKAAKAAAGSGEALPTTVAGLSKEADKLRDQLQQVRLDHAMQKLDSPAKLRDLRRRLARVLTKLRATHGEAK